MLNESVLAQSKNAPFKVADEMSLALRPATEILASPWTIPVFKVNVLSVGGMQ
jgi:hypothetical protein